MSIDLNEYVFFKGNKIEVGITNEEADRIFLSLNNSNIKKEYLTASSPKKTIQYEQFYIQKKLVTLEAFKKFVLETQYISDAEKDGWGWIWDGKWVKKKGVYWETPFGDDSDFFYHTNPAIFPVMQLSWNDAVEYTKWLSNIHGEKFRLPFEFEWEIFGNYAGINSMNNFHSDGTVKFSSEYHYTQVLMDNIKKSEFQMGFLWEWTLDWYKGYDDKTSNRDFGNIYKILRGGSLLSEDVQKSKEFRFRRCPTARSPYYGFRLVIEKK